MLSGHQIPQKCPLPMYSLCISYAFPMYPLCIPYVFPLYFLCISYVVPMYSLCIPYVFPMYFLCISYVFPMYFIDCPCIPYMESLKEFLKDSSREDTRIRAPGTSTLYRNLRRGGGPFGHHSGGNLINPPPHPHPRALPRILINPPPTPPPH